MTASDLEIDLIVERPGLPPVFIEIKSKDAVNEEDLSSLLKLTTDFGQCEAICLSQDPRKKKIEHSTVYPWREGLQYVFGIDDF